MRKDWTGIGCLILIIMESRIEENKRNDLGENYENYVNGVDNSFKFEHDSPLIKAASSVLGKYVESPPSFESKYRDEGIQVETLRSQHYAKVEEKLREKPHKKKKKKIKRLILNKTMEKGTNLATLGIPEEDSLTKEMRKEYSVQDLYSKFVKENTPHDPSRSLSVSKPTHRRTNTYDILDSQIVKPYNNRSKYFSNKLAF